MGRKKSRPVRSGGINIVSEADAPGQSSSALKNLVESDDSAKLQGSKELNKIIYVDIDRSNWASDVHYDVAEVGLHDVRFSDVVIDYRALEDSFKQSNFLLRLRLCDVAEDSFRLGQWPVIPSNRIFLEYQILADNRMADDGKPDMLFSGSFDGPDDGVSGLTHLVSLKFLSLRVILEVGDLVEVPSFRVQVEILKSAFDACGSLLEVVRQPWRKSLVNVMSWLRPEVTTSEAIYGTEGLVMPQDGSCDFSSTIDAQFDLASFYEAIKPPCNAGSLEEDLPDLLPHLRPYQRRAAYWMVQREKGAKRISSYNQENELFAPYCVPVDLVHKNCRMYYNPFNGNISLQPESSPPYVSGGILADEMGLGKTVELLACIFAHSKPLMEGGSFSESTTEIDQIKRQKIERVECICGAASESSKYKGLWVQCDICDAWQHAECVGYSPKKELIEEVRAREDYEKSSAKSKYSRKNRAKFSIIETDEKFMCSLCSELIEAAKTKIFSHATLIVCPAPILAQWHSEIMRHTRPGSLKVFIYEGARNLDSAATWKIDMTEIATADIVLTTYDVLKEDLSHDSDRHDGDRHFLRFQKRYPVVPTILTRVHWWRLCLDEAQMVESSKASVTEMAMRLNAQNRWCITGTPIQRRLDDLYGLLRFLRASPFDVYRWWIDVIRDPYERRDTVAMTFVHKFFRQIMWRSSKVHVSGELQLPPQEECFSWLIFSSIEEYFYQKQHATCVDHAHEIIRTLRNDVHRREPIYGSNASSNTYLSHNEIAKLLGPLLKLRQACCHPQVGGSGLCSLQRTPLSMEEILEVLIGKAKIEGEEELRKIVVALNGLAGIAIIEEDNQRAISLYKEALAMADENSNDFRLDPLLNLHINHNLAGLLKSSSGFLQECPLKEAQPSEINNVRKRKEASSDEIVSDDVKRKKMCKNDKLVSTADNELNKTCAETKNVSTQVGANGDDGEIDAEWHLSSRCYADVCLRKTCDKITQKYLSVFTSKLLVAQQDFNASFTEVLTLSKEVQDGAVNWWLYALDCIDQNKDSADELIRKIDSSFSKGSNGLGSIRVPSRVQSITSLKYIIQTGIDSLENSRQQLVNRLLEIDQTMDNPRDEDIERQRYCPNCYDGNGSLCIQCELDKLFQEYEARLFLVKKSNNDAVIASVEEAQDLQKRKYELNHFFRNKKSMEVFEAGHENSNQRSSRENIQVYRHPSALETTLGVIKSHSKTVLGRQESGSAKKHLLLFKAMRKEFTQARFLSIAQTQLLRAHDEIKMSISRIRLKETDDETTAVNILTREELIPYSLQFTNDKFLSLSSLARIRGQLRYLKGLVLGNQRTQQECGESFSGAGDTANLATSSLPTEKINANIKNEPCPICQERFFDQKMVFQCGHFVCCKCCLYMTEQASAHVGKGRQKWMMCPTCRQRTDIENIAFVAEKQSRNDDLKAEDSFESAIVVQGSYGTKIEAVTRRILRITSTDEAAKVLIFSSWNDVLDVLEHSLAINNITYVRMKGGRKSQVAIARFKGEGSGIEGGKAKRTHPLRPVCVLLMLIQHGANGLNLLEAQHVILVEPLLNPAAEAQAINRIHRIGQEKRTFIHRFIVKKTIEESIYKLNRNRVVCSTMKRKAKNFKDEPVLTVKDVESLFPVTVSDELPEEEDSHGESLRHLPPSVAAGLAAERRLLNGVS